MKSIWRAVIGAIIAAFVAPAVVALFYDYEVLGLSALMSAMVLPAMGLFAAAHRWQTNRRLMVYLVSAAVVGMFWGYLAVSAPHEGRSMAQFCFALYSVAAIAAGLTLLSQVHRNA